MTAQPRFDGFGDWLPPQARLRLGTIRFNHVPRMRRVESMAIAPDGRLIATANLHDPVILWDAATGQIVRRLGIHSTRRHGYSYSIHTVAFSADGTTLAVGRPGREIARHERQGGRRPSQPGGKVERWDVATGERLESFRGHEEPILGIAYSTDGRTMATADRSGVILIRDPATGAVRQRLIRAAATGGLSGIAISSDGSILVSCGDRHPVTLWDTLAGEIVREFDLGGAAASPGHDRVVLTPDGRTVFTLGAGVVEVWDAATGAHRSSIRSGSFNPDGTARHLDLRRPIEAIACTPDGRTLATASGDDVVQLWDVDSGQPTARFGPISGQAVGVAFNPDRRSLIAVGSFGTTQVWDLTTQQARVRTVGHQSPIQRLAYAADGQTLISVSDDAVCVADATDGTILRQLVLPCRTWREWALAPDGRWLGYQEVMDDRRITVIDVATGSVAQQIDQFRGTGSGSLYFCFAAEGPTIIVADAVEDEITFPFIDLATGREERRVVPVGWDRIPEELSRQGCLTLSPDGFTLASLASLRGHNDSIVLLDARTGAHRHRFVLPIRKPGKYPEHLVAGTIAFSADGSWLAALDSGNSLRLWDVALGRETARFRRQEVPAGTALAFAPNGRVIATGSGRPGEAGLIQLWDATTGCELDRFVGHQSGIGALAFSPDGRTLASGSRDTTVLIWDVARHE